MKVVFRAGRYVQEPLTVCFGEEMLGLLRGPFDDARAVAIDVNRRLQQIGTCSSSASVRREIALAAMRPFLA
jgi:hypothetical protein